MARKFDEITIDGGKRERRVTVKIDSPSGTFSADLDGTTYEAPMLETLKETLKQAAMRTDALTFRPYYMIDWDRRDLTVRAIAISTEAVAVERVSSYHRINSRDPRPRSCGLDLDDELRMNATSTEEIARYAATEGRLTTFGEREEERVMLIEATETSRAQLLEITKGLRAIERQEKQLDEKRKTLTQKAKQDVEAMRATKLST